jgi:UPF0755 protein
MMRRALLSLLVLGLIGSAAVWWFNYVIHAPMPLAQEGYELDVERGTSLRLLATRLGAEGILPYPRAFSAYGRLTGQAARIQAGEYELEAGTTPASLLQQLVQGRVRLHALTVLEGWTVSELLAAMAQHPAIRQTLQVETPVDLATALELEYPHAEGWFFPETYRFPRGTTDVQFLRTAHDLMRQKLAEAWAARAIGTSLKDPYEALILASIVERESALDAERPMIAGVFVRRLQKGMRLQTDPTVIYGLGTTFDGNLTRKHLKTDTPYNTYTRRGLPPTPISLPGEAALQAAVNPASGETLYFVASGLGDGSHVFTTTLEEHNAAVARYLAELRRRKRK